MLKADFGQQDKDEREAPLQPGDHCLELRQSRSWSGLVLLRFLPGAVPLRASCCGGLLEQGGGAVLQGLVVEVVVMVVGMVKMLRRAREERPTLAAMWGPFFPGGGGHLDKNLRGRAQD